jgi:uncharacterized protein YjbI with pentapeptide repeats
VTLVNQSAQPKPPKIEPLRWPELEAADASSVLSGDTREGEAFDGADFSGAELDFATFVSCSFDRSRFDDTTLRGVHFTDSALRHLDGPVFSAPRSSWRGVEVMTSRLGSAELYETNWRCVTVSDTKISYLNARAATWQDVVFRNCVIEELDLAYASLTRVAFSGCQLRSLSLDHARLTDVDLRRAELKVLKGLGGLGGAWVTPDQLTLLAPLLAAHLKIRIG